MAILLISDEILRDETAMKVMRNYFDEFMRLERKDGKVKYFVYKPGLPEDNVQVTCVLTRDENNVLKMLNVIITNNRI